MTAFEPNGGGQNARLREERRIALSSEAADQPFATHVRATALAVLGKESDAWTPVEWSKAAITLASAVVAVAGDINKIGTCAVCGGRGEVEATPGQPGDGPMPCPNCQPEPTS